MAALRLSSTAAPAPAAAASNSIQSAVADTIQPPPAKKLKRDYSALTKPATSSSSSTSSSFTPSLPSQSQSQSQPAPVGRSERAGLNFNVGEISRILKTQRVTSRVGGGAPVYLAAVLEYLTTELLDVAAHTAKQAHALASASDTDGNTNNSATVTITPEHIAEGVAGDEELKRVMDDNAKHEQSAGSRLEHSSHAVHMPREEATHSSNAHANADDVGSAESSGQPAYNSTNQPLGQLPLPTSYRSTSSQAISRSTMHDAAPPDDAG